MLEQIIKLKLYLFSNFILKSYIRNILFLRQDTTNFVNCFHFSYAGPEFQKIQSRWTESFSQTYLVSNREVIVASVDARGSAYQGFYLFLSNLSFIFEK